MEDLYMWKDVLMALFNLIDSDHSGRILCCFRYFTLYIIGYITREELADVIKLVTYDENVINEVNQAYVEEIISAMDFDKNGKIDMNEFLGKF